MDDEGSPRDQQLRKNNRPHCFYLWFIHGKAVCSEEVQDRPCAYPFWNCPARIDLSNSIPEETTSSTLQKVSSSEYV